MRDIFGIVKEDGTRQFHTAYVEIGKKNGQVGACGGGGAVSAVCGHEPSAEVYGAAADRQQASIVFDVANQMVKMSPALMKRSKIMTATKRIVNYTNAGFIRCCQPKSAQSMVLTYPDSSLTSFTRSRTENFMMFLPKAPVTRVSSRYSLS